MNKNAQIKLIVFIVLCLTVFTILITSNLDFGEPPEQAQNNKIKDYDGNLVNSNESYLWKRTSNSETYRNPDGTHTTTFGGSYIDSKERRFPVYRHMTDVINLNKTEEVDKITLKGLESETNLTFIALNPAGNSMPIQSVVGFNVFINKTSGNYKWGYNLKLPNTQFVALVNITSDEELTNDSKYVYVDGLKISFDDVLEYNYSYTLHKTSNYSAYYEITKDYQGHGISKNDIIVIDPTITLQEPDTGNMEDACTYLELGNCLQSITSLIAKNGFSANNIFFIKFNISSIPKNSDIISSNMSVYAVAITEAIKYDISIYNVTNQTWNEDDLGSYSVLPLLEGKLETKSLNDSDEGWIDWNVGSALNTSLGNGDVNQTFAIRYDQEDSETDRPSFVVYSKEYTDDTSLRPKLEIIYQANINIISPSPSQIFTEDAPTTLFNISTSINMSSCVYELDSISNYSMNKISETSFSLTNTSMVDGVHSVKFFCNDSLNNFHISDSVSFDVDSVNVTVCRDLSVADRRYEMIDNISATGNCIIFGTSNDNQTLDMNGFNMIGDSSGIGATIDGIGSPHIVKNGIIENFNIGVSKAGTWSLFDFDFIIDNVTIKDSSVGVSADTGGTIVNNSIFLDNNIGIDVDSSSVGIIINSSDIINSTQYGFRGYTFDSGGFGFPSGVIINSNISGSTTYDVYSKFTGVSDNKGTKIVNTTYDTEISENELTRIWYLNIQVNDSTGSALEDTSINITNISSVNIFSGLTDVNGEVSQQELIEYINNSGTTSYHTPHNITIEKEDYETQIISLNLTENKSTSIDATLLLSIDVTLNSPGNDTSQTTPTEFNCSVETSGKEISNITLFIWNSPFIYTETKDITGFSNSTIFSVTFGNDASYEWNCKATNNISESKFADNNFTVHIETNSPAINLQKPTSNEFLNNGTNVYFNFTATDQQGMDVCQLWGNWTGTWKNNFTWNNITSGVQNFTTLNISESNGNIWNVFCNDTVGNGGFAASNFTFNIDETLPNITINSISTIAGSQTIQFNSTESDLNLYTCFYSIFNSTGEIDGISENISYTCNTITPATSSSFGTFNLTIYSRDLALNEKSTTQSFTTSNPQPSPGGGGGSITMHGVTLLEATNFTITTLNLKSQLDMVIAKDSAKSRSKDFLVTNFGLEPIVVEIICDTQNVNESSQDIDICDYVSFENKTMVVQPSEEIRSRGTFNLETPNGTKLFDEYYFNILAVRTIGDEQRFSKLSVSARVTFLSTIFYKWSSIGGLVVPTLFVAILFGIIAFSLVFFFLRNRFLVPGFFIAMVSGFAVVALVYFVI